MNKLEIIQKKINFIAAEIREHKIEHYRLHKELQKAKIKSLYEQKKFILMKGFHFSNVCVEPKKKDYIGITAIVRDITYTPDFVDPNGKWIIEVKGFANDVFPIKWKLFKSIKNKNLSHSVNFYL